MPQPIQICFAFIRKNKENNIRTYDIINKLFRHRHKLSNGNTTKPVLLLRKKWEKAKAKRKNKVERETLHLI